MACKIGSENDDTNDFTEQARRKGRVDSLAYHLSNETEDVSRACFPLPTSKDGDERGECGRRKKCKCGGSEKR